MDDNTIIRYLNAIGRDLNRIATALETISDSNLYRCPKPDISRIGLITASEYNKFGSRAPHYGEFWWMNANEEAPKEAPMVTKEGKVERVSTDVTWGKARPVLYIANGSEYAYKQVARVGRYFFTYIGGDMMICNVCLPETVVYSQIMGWSQETWMNKILGKDLQKK